MKAQVPNEVIDRILLYCDVSIAIHLRREYVKKQLLQLKSLPKRWMVMTDRDLISWLMYYNVQRFNSTTMNWAARKGHLEVIKWLYEKRQEGYSTVAINDAAGNILSRLPDLSSSWKTLSTLRHQVISSSFPSHRATSAVQLGHLVAFPGTSLKQKGHSLIRSVVIF